MRHGLTAETVIGALEDAEDYRAFEATIIADYDAQISCEMRTRVAIGRLLWRLRCATTIETSLYDIQADHLNEPGHRNPVQPASRQSIYALFERRTLSSADEVFTSAEPFPKRTVDFDGRGLGRSAMNSRANDIRELCVGEPRCSG